MSQGMYFVLSQYLFRNHYTSDKSECHQIDHTFINNKFLQPLHYISMSIF